MFKFKQDIYLKFLHFVFTVQMVQTLKNFLENTWKPFANQCKEKFTKSWECYHFHSYLNSEIAKKEKVEFSKKKKLSMTREINKAKNGNELKIDLQPLNALPFPRNYKTH